MRFLSIFSHEPVNRPPSPAEMEQMGRLIEEAMKAGWLLHTEGVSFGQQGFRVQRDAGGATCVIDGPFTETKEVIGGYALMAAASKEEVIALTRRFLAVAGSGTCEIYPLYEAPASG